MTMRKRYSILSTCLCLAIFSSCDDTHKITHGNLIMEISSNLYTAVNVQNEDVLSTLGPSEYLVIGSGELTDFSLKSYEIETLANPMTGEVHVFTGFNKTHGISKKITIKALRNQPDVLLVDVSYINQSDKDLLLKGWVNHGYSIRPNGDQPPFWVFQGSSTNERLDWVKPVEEGYYQKNFLGMNSSDYGGGIPVTDVWRKDIGIAVGHIAPTPKQVSLPTELKKYEDEVSVGVMEEFPYPTYLKSGDTLNTLETFVSVHKGDYFNGLKQFAQVMKTRGVIPPPSEPAAYEPIWCAWGYEREFTLEEVTGTLPKVKELGIKWAVLDDGFQQAEGDWHTNETKFPNGDAQIKALVNTIHDYQLKAKLWWAPLAADHGSALLRENPNMRLHLADWAPQYITWWDAYYLSPTNPDTKKHTKEVINLFLNDWGFDGLKMDGQHMNAIAADHSPYAAIDQPELAPELLPEFFKLIYTQARAIKPNAVVENCPCGTCMSYYNMPYMNQAVSSDPLSSWQIRHKGKTYKALIPNTAYYGDHVELSDDANDFASSFGIGAVLGTKFTWPKDNPQASGTFQLTPEKEVVWKKWFGLYNQKMLSQEEYLGHLYDIGYDLPETHVIQKQDTLHYAFYADQYDGEVEFRGLAEEGVYVVYDYINETNLGEITRKNPTLSVSFDKNLLVEVYMN